VNNFRDHAGTKPVLLQAFKLKCVRGERRLFNDLDLQVEAGTCLLMQGANGSGKTSLLRILAGLTPAASGVVHWNGEEIGQLGDEYRNELLYCGHLNGLKEELSAEENLLSAATLRGQPLNPDAVRLALRQAGLADREDLPVRVLSQGQRRRATLARLLLEDRRPAWILDEPLMALDAGAVRWLAGVIDQHLATGGLVVLTSHQYIPLVNRVRSMSLS
jgi:heme exporter protein A